MNWNNNDTKYIIKRFIIYILIAMAMFIIGTWKADAATIYHGNLTQQVTRIWQTSNNTRLCDSWSSPAVCTLNVGTDTTLNGTFLFKANTYYGYQGYKYQFSGQIEGVGPQISFLNVSIMTNPGSEMGYCETKTSTNGTSVSFTSTCDIPGGLKGQDYANYLNFNLGTTVKLSQFTLNLKLDSDYFLYQDNQTQINNNVSEINDSIKNSNVTTSDADDFSNNEAFSDSTGLESVIQLPLNMVNSLTSTCQPIQVTIPFIDYTGEIPCMSTIYTSKFNTLYTIVKIVINGFFVYRLLLKVYELVHNAKQPDEDKLEVIDL